MILQHKCQTEDINSRKYLKVTNDLEILNFRSVYFSQKGPKIMIDLIKGSRGKMNQPTIKPGYPVLLYQPFIPTAQISSEF